MSQMLDEFRDRRIFGTAELAEVATLLLRQLGARQERDTVTEYPDERTVRYYLSQGLIPPPDDKSGLRSVFGFRHLLAILVVKRLQSEHLQIRKIREIIDGRSEAELERLLGLETQTERESNEAKRFLEGLLVSPEPPMAMRIPSAHLRHHGRPRPERWHRFELAPGLEINIAADFRLPADPAILQEVVDEFRRLVSGRN